MDQKLLRVHPPAFKAKIALESIKEQKTTAELASIYSVRPTQITKWKKRALDFISQILSDKFHRQQKSDGELKQMQRIGPKMIEEIRKAQNEFLLNIHTSQSNLFD